MCRWDGRLVRFCTIWGNELSPVIGRNTNMRFILSFFVIAPAWVVFFIFVTPFVLLLTFKSILTTAFVPETIGLFSWLGVLLWKYSIGVLIYEKYAEFLNVPALRFKICMTYNFIFSIILIYRIIPFDYIAPFSFVSFVCNMYAIYFIAKLIVMVERKREVRFNEYLGTFIAVWFYLVGIWFLQPRINKVFLSKDN